MGYDARVGSDGVEAERALSGHLGNALCKEVFRAVKGVVQAPSSPIGQKAIPKVAVKEGVLCLGLAELLVKTNDANQIDGAADSVLGYKDRFGVRNRLPRRKTVFGQTHRVVAAAIFRSERIMAAECGTRG